VLLWRGLQSVDNLHTPYGLSRRLPHDLDKLKVGRDKLLLSGPLLAMALTNGSRTPSGL
jgi:hypothetical protein